MTVERQRGETFVAGLRMTAKLSVSGLVGIGVGLTTEQNEAGLAPLFERRGHGPGPTPFEPYGGPAVPMKCAGMTYGLSRLVVVLRTPPSRMSPEKP